MNTPYSPMSCDRILLKRMLWVTALASSVWLWLTSPTTPVLLPEPTAPTAAIGWPRYSRPAA
jgi:hypothetical protein